MSMRTVRAAAVSIACAATLAGPAQAAIIAFSATRENVSPVVGVPGGRCGGQITVTIAPGAISSTGTSNLGNFSLNESHCIAGFPPNPFSQGVFTWTFDDGATLFGTYTGVASLSAMPGVFGLTSDVIIGGGTGRLLGATGALRGAGTLRLGMVNGQRVSIGAGAITGAINAPGVPEPATWSLMIGGFGLAGAALRKRRSLPA